MSRARRTLIGRVDPKTGEIIPTDGRNRKSKTKETAEKDTDFKALYEKLLKKCAAQETLITALKEDFSKLKEKES